MVILDWTYRIGRTGCVCRIAGLLSLLLLASPLCAEQAPPQATPPEAPGVAALPPAAKPVPTYLLRHKLVAGRQERYRITLEGKGTLSTAQGKLLLPVTLGIGLLAAQTVDDVYLDGSGTVTAHFAATSARANGVEDARAYQTWLASGIVAGGLAPVRVTVTPTGLRQIANGGRSGDIQFCPALSPGSLARVVEGIAFPEQAIKVGESWGTPAGTDAYCRTTLASMNSTKGRSIARLKQASAWPIQSETPGGLLGPGQQIPVAGRQAADLDLRFDLDQGILLSATGSVDVSATLSPATSEARHLLLRLALRIERVETAEGTPGR